MVYPTVAVNTTMTGRTSSKVEYNVTLGQNTTIKTVVTSDDLKLRSWFADTSIYDPTKEDDQKENEDDTEKKKKEPKRFVIGLEVKWISKRKRKPKRKRRRAAFSVRLRKHLTIVNLVSRRKRKPRKRKRRRAALSVRKHLAIVTLCYGTNCLIYQATPGAYPLTLLFGLPREQNIYVGFGAQREAENLQAEFSIVRPRFQMTAVDIRCPAHPVFNPPDLSRATLRSLGRRVLRRDVPPNRIGQSSWAAANLTTDQVENLTIAAYTSYKIGINLFGSSLDE